MFREFDYSHLQKLRKLKLMTMTESDGNIYDDDEIKIQKDYLIN